MGEFSLLMQLLAFKDSNWICLSLVPFSLYQVISIQYCAPQCFAVILPLSGTHFLLLCLLYLFFLCVAAHSSSMDYNVVVSKVNLLFWYSLHHYDLHPKSIYCYYPHIICCHNYYLLREQSKSFLLFYP